MRDPTFVIIVPADALEPWGTRPSAGAVLSANSDMIVGTNWKSQDYVYGKGSTSVLGKKMDWHIGGMWLIHSNKHHKDNLL